MSQAVNLPHQKGRVAGRNGKGLLQKPTTKPQPNERQLEKTFSVEFRDSAIGRQPYMKGSGLAVWEVIMIARQYDFDAQRVAEYYPYPVENIMAALRYYFEFQREIDPLIEDANFGFDALKKKLPDLQPFEVRLDSLDSEPRQ